MRTWNLAAGDPLNLTLAADFRFCAPDYVNDQIWELLIGGGSPPALALHTTYGLRARSMRIFPRFTLNGQMVNDPAQFAQPPRLRRFYPNLLVIGCSPFAALDVQAEFWIPDSHAAVCRLTMSNRSAGPLSVLLELCAQLVPLDGQPLGAQSQHSVNILSGKTADLEPVLFITGGPQPGLGPYPSLALELAIAGGASRTLTWSQAALGSREASFELARRCASRPLDVERARIELQNAAQVLEVETGDPDWDAALAFSQATGLRLFFGGSQQLPNPSFVLARQPDHGHSPSADGIEHSRAWNGQPPLESLYLAGNIPGAPELALGLLRNFLATQQGDGTVDDRPGLAGQRSQRLAAPLLASLAWQVQQHSAQVEFLSDIQPGLAAFSRAWFDHQHDRDQDGFPEWDHPAQSALEDNPAFSLWPLAGLGADITSHESPALAALLSAEFQAQSRIAGLLGHSSLQAECSASSARLDQLVEECWDNGAAIHRYRDRESHASPAGRNLGSRRGPGTLAVGATLAQPSRLQVQVHFKGETMRRPTVTLAGTHGGEAVQELLEGADFQWAEGRAAATSRKLFTHLERVEVTRLEKRDQLSVSVLDFQHEDISLLLPLWAGSLEPQRARSLVSRTLLAPGRFACPYGIPSFPAGPEERVPEVHLPWNSLVGEGLLAYGMRAEAADLTTRLMGAVIRNLKEQHAFAQAYQAVTGAGLGERNAVQGLAPLGLFLAVLGVGIQSPERVVLQGSNPFPWPVVVKYRGLTVARQAGQTRVTFPSGQSVTLDDPADALVTAE